MESGSALLKCWMGAFLTLMSHSAAHADTPSLGPIDAKLSAEQRAFVSRALVKFGEKSPDFALQSAKALRHVTNDTTSGRWIIRIEGGRYCQANRCLTLMVSGEINAKRAVEAMFYGGRYVTMAEPDHEHVGTSTLCFNTQKSAGDGPCAIESGLGWIIH